MFNRKFLIASACATTLLLGACSSTITNNSASSSPAAQRQSIDAQVNNAMSSLYAQVPDARDVVAKAKGVLVFPSVVSAGFVVGGSYGQGALREGGAITGYYSITSASVGWLAGANSKALYLAFMTQEALDKFKASNGWTAGVDANVTAVTVAANGSIDLRAIREPVVSFTLSNGGLMANLSVEGTKITKLNMQAQ